jgi:CheY-like chemotaxis protein
MMYRIAVIEDHPDNQEVMKFILESVPDYEVIVFNNAIEIKHLLTQGESFDLIISDIALPHMTGIEFVRFVRNELKQTMVPIIAASAHAFDASREAAMEAGFDAYLTKPIKVGTLLSLVERCLRKDKLAA